MTGKIAYILINISGCFAPSARGGGGRAMAGGGCDGCGCSIIALGRTGNALEFGKLIVG